ncbi:MAG: DUF2177 family protein [Anaerolineaceae bacterium]|nr:DUF2177 family protein [Anaerolineaceae bacterium]
MNIKNFFIGLAAFLAIDAFWLGFVASKLYKSKLGYLMADKPNLVAAGIFYVLFIIGLLYFVINPALVQKDLLKAVLSGALFGLITYATYDLTNLATVKDWPLLITVIDMAWGTFLGAVTTLVIMLFNR